MNAVTSTEAPKPTLASSRPLTQCKTIGEALQTREMVQRLRQALPTHLNPERMLRVLALCISKTPLLASAPLRDLLGAVFTLASLGLEPNTPLGHAYLIPFEKNTKVKGENGKETWEKSVTIQVVIGYRGFIDLARRTGTLVSIHADVVYQGDEFDFEYGTNMHLRHVPKGARTGVPTHAYCHVKLKDGEAFEVLPYAEVLKTRDKSEGYRYALTKKDAVQAWIRKAYESNPWVAYEHEMAQKTMVRRLSKMLPMTIEFMTASSIDGGSEGGKIRWASAFDANPGQLDAIDIDDSPVYDDPADTNDDASQRSIERNGDTPMGGAVVGDAREKEPVAAQRAAAETTQTDESRDGAAEPTQQQAGAREISPEPIGDGRFQWDDWTAAYVARLEQIEKGGTVADMRALQADNAEHLRSLKKAAIKLYDQVMQASGRCASVLVGGAPQ